MANEATADGIAPDAGDGSPDGTHDDATADTVAVDTPSDGSSSEDEYGTDVGVPDVGPADPVVELVGPPIVLDDTTNPGGRPIVAWNGTGWGAAWGQSLRPVVFRPLTDLGDPVGPVVSIDSELTGLYIDLAWRVDHYLVVASDGGRGIDAVVIDPTGDPRTDVNRLVGDAAYPSIAWCQTCDGWLLGFVPSYGGPAGMAVRAAVVGESATLIDEWRTVASGSPTGGPRVLALKTGAAFAWLERDGVWYRKISWPAIEEAPSARLVLPCHAGGDSGGVVAAAGFLDVVVIITMDGVDVWTVALDNTTATVVAGPTVVGPSRVRDRVPDIAGVSGRPYLAACYVVGPGPIGGSGDDGLEFRLLAPNGAALGAPLMLAEHVWTINGCAIAWSGSEFVVVYLTGGATADDPNIIVARRVRPLV